ncbi:hypothetical protein CVT26_004705 [Gymnopilus dilepis]|uniref:Uncharacterized protein n=1 Tax=Gymnopilus dilepis TaxID=231916 RepID=A0A409XZD0_9AGAR|nr:hypothetical protein CVT26_004705 [Gymnopilus dilepis]
MSDGTGDACAFICGGCCEPPLFHFTFGRSLIQEAGTGIVFFSALTSWSGTQALGANGCCSKNRNAGCCGGCCSDKFDEDAFDAQVKKDLEKTRDPNAKGKETTPATPMTEQPQSTEEMTLPNPYGGQPRATDEISLPNPHDST